MTSDRRAGLIVLGVLMAFIGLAVVGAVAIASYVGGVAVGAMR